MTTAKGLIDACQPRDRASIARLVAAIAAKDWHIKPGLATSYLDPVTVQAWHGSGGTGINTYETLHVQVLLDGQDRPLFADTFTAEELQLPNYIPRRQRAGTQI
jgi:hypothetical protein